MEHILGQVQKQLKQGLENAWTLGQDIISNVPDGWEIMDMNRTWTTDNEHEHGISSEDWEFEFEEWMEFEVELDSNGHDIADLDQSFGDNHFRITDRTGNDT